MMELKRPYIRVRRGAATSYGGCQMWSEDKNIRKCGCGPVAALDLVLYLSGRQGQPIPLEDYDRDLRFLCRHFFPLIPSSGINGILLAIGLDRLFRHYRLPYRAFWAVSGPRFWDRVQELLAQDIPAIISVGPNFPFLWGKKKLRFYRKAHDGSLVPAASTVAHYVTVTGIEDDLMRISSWGVEYYIERKEYEEYVRRHSAALVSNVLMVRRTS
ncbi:MAG: hypothetical protein IK095_07680 [Oscillospiraceae bacterium]|nr:hypothetical protein [Oscillospiraceae bacterium]